MEHVDHVNGVHGTLELEIAEIEDLGHQHIRIQVEIPTKLTKEQRELLEKFASLSGEETNPAASRFWSKVSEILGKE
jgi:DnaJ-class molecular chaperone